MLLLPSTRSLHWMKEGKNCSWNWKQPRRGLNTISKEIGQLMAKGRQGRRQRKKNRPWPLLKPAIPPLQEGLDLIDTAIADN